MSPHFRIPRAFGRLSRPAAAAAAMAGVLAASAAACGNTSQPAGTKAAVTHVNVAVVPITDAAPFFLALSDGFFRQEHLDVTYRTTPKSTAAIGDMAGGSVDIVAAANYVSFLEAQARGTMNITIVADNSLCGTATQNVLVLPSSHIIVPANLAGKTVAVNINPNIQTLTIGTVLRADNLNPASVHYVEIPFPDMAAALKAGRVDAISEVEPYLTAAEESVGAESVLAQCTGPTAGIALSGYIATAAWARTHLAAARAFQRAIEKAQALADTNRAAVQKILPRYIPVTAGTADLVNFNTFPVRMDAARLQRLADLMRTAGMLSKPLNVTPLLLRPAQSR